MGSGIDNRSDAADRRSPAPPRRAVPDASGAGPSPARIAACGGDAGLVLAFCSGLDPRRAATEIADAAGDVAAVGMTGKGTIGRDGIVEEGCSAIAFGPDVATGIGRARAGLGRPARSRARCDGRGARRRWAKRRTSSSCSCSTRPAPTRQTRSPAPTTSPARRSARRRRRRRRRAAQLHRRRARSARPSLAVALAAPNAVGLGTRPRLQGDRVALDRHALRRPEGDRARRPPRERGLPRAARLRRASSLTDEEFEALAVTHPLAQPELNGDTRLRHVRWRDGSALACATHLPPGAAVEFTHQAPMDIVAAASQAVGESLSALGRPPAAALIFDCAGRKGAIGGALGLESSALYSAFDSVPPVAGAFTYGEVARARGAKGDRNHAVVVATLA